MSPTPAAAQGRVLVVEDDPDAAYYFVHVLSRHGPFRGTHTGDPAAALNLAAGADWDLMLTDPDLPGTAALEFLTALRRVTPSVPMVVVTLDDPAVFGSAGDWARVNPDAVLAKPIRASRLISTVVTLTGTSVSTHRS